MDLYEAIYKRHVVRDFKEQIVPDEVLKRILDAGMQAPTHDHLRNWEFVILKDKEDNYARYSKRNRVPLYLYGVGSGALLPADCPMVSLLPALCRLLGLPEPYFLDR